VKVNGTTVWLCDSPPSAITDFAASEDRTDGVECTWSPADGQPTPTYDLYRDGVLITKGVSSGYLDTSAAEAVTYTYFVRAINTMGETDSNTDSGMRVCACDCNYCTCNCNYSCTCNCAYYMLDMTTKYRNFNEEDGIISVLEWWDFANDDIFK
jgi:hypothetical protein